MKEQLDQVISLAQGIWAFRWQAVGVAWVVALVGWAALYFQIVPSYTATAQVYVETETVLRPLMEGLALDVDFNKQVDLMAHRLMSRPNLESVVADTGLDERGGEVLPMAVAVEALRKNLSLTARPPSSRNQVTSNIYNIAYVNPDPTVAKHVVESLIQAFRERTLEEIRDESERGKRFIEQQISEQAEAMAAAEEKVREFRQRHLDILSGEGQGFFDRLHAAERAVADVERAIDETTSRRLSIQRELDRTPAFVRAVGPDGSLVPTPLEAKLIELRETLAQLRFKYTESHPDVVAAKESISRVEAAIRSGDNPANMVPNQTYQQLELRLRQTGSDLAALRARKVAALRQHEALAEQVVTQPAIEDELAGMNQDAAAAKERLRDLEKRRQSMETLENLDQKSLQLYFRVIEPPSVPAAAVLADVWRKKVRLSVAVLAAAGAAGVALALVLLQLQSPIRGQHSLRGLTGLPVFGVVSRSPTRATLLRERFGLTGWALSLVFLVVAFGANLLLQNASLYGPHTEIHAPQAGNGNRDS
ncbi:XrtA system polysaccharide chain length determinant [Thiococcus pfennigii]|jgi:polysaccharide chain length determinant protein (PEP-CTERM system associated)|uniref:XrtA system polysaccharide chain length determinant n=1 Tax=Thiococcus pfennigii TaxID=1057 RepID=UPI001907A5C7|nr:XrtA system polysaccharide chain length determinant [Thiococcus pfennigii]MBK1699567.1 hypothetical protein [Thiococcus pfennigii]MBK1731492.1 hypothetical protein [Thiococcus pfennigii]